MITLETVRTMIRRLPGAVESRSYGTPGFKVGRKLFARLHQKEDAIVVLLDSVEQQRQLIARDPAAFYITDHYRGYPAVLVRPFLEDEAFFELLELAWRRVAGARNIRAYESGLG